MSDQQGTEPNAERPTQPPKAGDPAKEGAIAQYLLDNDYWKLSSHELAELMLAGWVVLWK